MEPDEIVKGWEIAKGQFVLVEDDELEALGGARRLARHRHHAVRRAAQVDPIFFDRTYFLVPRRRPPPAGRTCCS